MLAAAGGSQLCSHHSACGNTLAALLLQGSGLVARGKEGGRGMSKTGPGAEARRAPVGLPSRCEPSGTPAPRGRTVWEDGQCPLPGSCSMDPLSCSCASCSSSGQPLGTSMGPITRPEPLTDGPPPHPPTGALGQPHPPENPASLTAEAGSAHGR